MEAVFGQDGPYDLNNTDTKSRSRKRLPIYQMFRNPKLVALRAVSTSDFMTAEAAQLPWEVLSVVATQ